MIRTPQSLPRPTEPFLTAINTNPDDLNPLIETAHDTRTHAYTHVRGHCWRLRVDASSRLDRL